MEQESDPTKRAACFIRRDVANHTNGGGKKINATVCTAATPVWRAISDRLNPPACTRQTPTHPATDCCLPAYPPGCWSAAAIMDGTSHFLIPGGLEFNLSRAPSEAKHTRVWVHPKRLKLEHRPRTERRLLLAWTARKGNDGCAPGRWGGSEQRWGGRVLEQNMLYYSSLTEMMLAPNEFPSRMPLLSCLPAAPTVTLLAWRDIISYRLPVRIWAHCEERTLHTYCTAWLAP